MCNEDCYEAGGIFTIAGPTGTYFISSPFNTECEWALWDASANAGTGIVAISASNPTLINMTTSIGPTIGLLSGGADNNAFDGIIFPVSATQNHIPFEYWQPLGRGKGIYVATTISGGDIFVAITFRRRSLKVIPRLPAYKPHTHVPLSGKLARTFYEGFDEATPGETGVSSDPEPHQDTGTFRRNVAYVSRADHNPMHELDKKVSKRR